MPQDQGVCVVTSWDEGIEFHTDDPIAAQADWVHIEDQFRTAMDLLGRHHEVVGAFLDGGQGMMTYVLGNRGAAGKFILPAEDARFVAQAIEDGDLLGLWHTHPLGHRYPSPADWSGHPRGIPMYIVSVESDTEFMVLRFDDSNRPGVQADPDD